MTMSYDTQIAAARQIISAHNNTISDDAKIDFDAFLACLQKAGGTTEQALLSVTFEDLEDCGLPRILARSIAQTFRGKGDGSGGGATGFVSERKAYGMTVRELLERYEPAEPDTPVAKRLKTVCKGHPCIVFTDEGFVDVERSEAVVMDLKNGFSPQQTVLNGKGIPVRLRNIGDLPDRFFAENPIYPGRALRTGERCDQCHRSWQGVPMEVRQLVRLAVEKNEVDISTIADVIDLIDLVSGAQISFADLAQRFPQAAMDFDKRKKNNSLPTLQIVTGDFRCDETTRQNNPFGAGQNRSC
jgi:hypothetical protein